MAVRLSGSPELKQFLTEEKVATLAVPVATDGTLHIATMNYLHQENPLHFYFMTSRGSEKCRLLKAGPFKAACNVGAYYGTPFTLQMRGIACILDKAERAELLEKYMQKRGTSNKNVEGTDSILVEFAPNWARFTDFSKGWNTTFLELE